MSSKRNILKKVVSEKGKDILMKPAELRSALIKEDGEAVYYAIQVELFLNASRMGGILQEQTKLAALGHAGFAAALQRITNNTGLIYDTVKEIGNDLLYACEYDQKIWAQVELPDVKKLPLVEKKAKGVQAVEGEARGVNAYQNALVWLREDKNVDIQVTPAKLMPTRSKEAKQARLYLERAAEDGYVKAYRLLGLLYYYGVGGDQDDKKAYDCIMKSGSLASEAYSQEAKKVVLEILDKRENEKKKNKNVMLFSVLVFVSIVALKILAGPISGAVLFGILAFVNAAGDIYFLYIQSGSEKKRRNLCNVSLVLWCLFLLVMCW